MRTKQSNSQLKVGSQVVQAQLPTAANNTNRLLPGQTFYVTAAELREGNVDISPLLAYCATPTQAAQLLLPFVLKAQNSTNPTQTQEPRGA